jgi:hypothetical protein
LHSKNVLVLAMIRIKLVRHTTHIQQLRHPPGMGFKYSLFVNGNSLGPYERRMIVGMRVKKIVTDEQLVFRDDGVSMTVAQLLQDRLEETKSSHTQTESSQLSIMGAPSSGMWPQFSVRFGGGPMKPGALGFNGLGQVSYEGDCLKIRGNRRKNLGMSKQEDLLPVRAIASSKVQAEVIEMILQPGLNFSESMQGVPVRLEFATSQDAHELWELLNIRAGELPHGLSYAKTATGDLI